MSASASAPHPTTLPPPPPAAQAASDQLLLEIRRAILAQGGWMSFAEFMSRALYTPGLGYYSGGAEKFGAAGDFVTAPEISPLFARALARQVAEILEASGPEASVLEAGAGSGRLAADLLAELEKLGCLPRHYAILELSGELRGRQFDTLAAQVPHLAGRVRWLDTLPTDFSGCVLGNELLDAMPVHPFQWDGTGFLEKGVTWTAAGLDWSLRPATGRLAAQCEALWANLRGQPAWAEVDAAGFESEICLAAPAWVAEWGQRLVRGGVLLLDYGFPRREYYHPGRQGGTLMCHYRHQAHTDPFFLPGLQDITAHVDFTSLADGAFEAGLTVDAYTSQASFLMNCGILEALAALGAPGSPEYSRGNTALNLLLSPAEMGELFKVILFSKNLPPPAGGPLGFRRGDRLHAL